MYEEGRPLHSSVCMSLVELVRSLMGAPPEFAHIVAVADCLLLLHPASATYITHLRQSYYFLLSPSPPDPSPMLYSRKGNSGKLLRLYQATVVTGNRFLKLSYFPNI